jgi:hypothetical protein
MNTLQEIPKDQLDIFKENVSNWLKIDNDIYELEKKIKLLKKKRKEDEKEVTQFMVKFNISDLNTNNGKIKCNARNTKKPFNKNNIRENLSKVIQDINSIDKAMDLIINNREIVTTYKLTKPKK